MSCQDWTLRRAIYFYTFNYFKKVSLVACYSDEHSFKKLFFSVYALLQLRIVIPADTTYSTIAQLYFCG